MAPTCAGVRLPHSVGWLHRSPSLYGHAAVLRLRACYPQAASSRPSATSPLSTTLHCTHRVGCNWCRKNYQRFLSAHEAQELRAAGAETAAADEAAVEQPAASQFHDASAIAGGSGTGASTSTVSHASAHRACRKRLAETEVTSPQWGHNGMRERPTTVVHLHATIAAFHDMPKTLQFEYFGQRQFIRSVPVTAWC